MAPVDGLRQDVKGAMRSLSKSPGFAVAALITLALGIGATSAIFSVVKAVLLTPLPYAEPEQRVLIWSQWISFDKTWLSDQEIVDYRNFSKTMTAVGGVVHGTAEPHRRRRAGARRRRFRDREHVRRARRAAAHRPGVHRRPRIVRTVRRSRSSAIRSGRRATAAIRRSSAARCC